MDKEKVRQILTTLNAKRVCQNGPKQSASFFSWKTHTTAQTTTTLTRSCPMWCTPQNWKVSSKEPIFSQLKTSILKALSQNDFKRCFESWKAHVRQCVVSDEIILKSIICRYNNLVNKVCFDPISLFNSHTSYYIPIHAHIFQVISSLQALWLKFCIHFPSLPCMQHSLPILLCLIWPPW